MILLNIRATTLLSRLLVSELSKRQKSYILNVSSMAGFYPVPFKSVYAASKAYIYSFSRSLREELKQTSIRVSVLHPGPMATNAQIAERISKHSWLARKTVLTSQEVAEIALEQMFQNEPVIIPGWINKIMHRLSQIIPPSFILPILRRNIARELT